MRRHVAINALFLEPPMGGIETYLRELCRELLRRPGAPRLTIFAGPSGHAALAREDWAGEAELVRAPVLGRNGARALSELTVLGSLAARRGADVIHSVAMTGPLAGGLARVVTVPDTIWITHREDTLTHRLWRVVVPRVAARSHRVLAISHAAADELRAHMGVPADKLDVVPLGFGSPGATEVAGEEEVRRVLGLPAGAQVVLNVGQKKPHRNLERLIGAMVAVRARVPAAVLVLPGPPNPEAEQALRELATRRGLPDGAVVIPGYVDRPIVEGLYACAGAFVLPSLVEGFGLPVLEAMARAAPVACSATSAPGEIAGDAALLFDPTDEAQIADATARLLEDAALAVDLRRRGPERAAQYTWARCAEGTAASYERAIAAYAGARGA